MKRAWLSLLMLAAALCALPAHAAFHLFRIDQVYSNADGSVQYVVLRESTGSNFENFWKDNDVFLEATSAAAGVQRFPFPANLPSTATASKSVLVATSGFAALGLVAPDFTIPNGFVPRAGGSLRYANAASNVDTVTLPPLPADGATAIDHNGANVAATPTNFAGATAMLTATPPPPTAPDLDQHGLTGSWFEPASSGQGFEIEFYPNLAGPSAALVQGAWFTFDTAAPGGADHNRWYTFSGTGQSGQVNVPVTIFQNTGGNFDAPPITSATAVGTGTLAFADCSNGTFTYAFSDGSGRGGSIPLTRITPNVTCAVGAATAADADFALSGNWFDPATSGQGFVFEINPRAPIAFFAWYTYAPSGQMAGASGQRWFTGQGAFAPGMRSIPLALFETTGGVFDTPTPAMQATNPVGTAVATFMTCTSAQLQFNFTAGSNAGHAGMITLTRVGPAPPGCANAANDVSMAPPPSMMGYPPGSGYGP